jgi:hypothetical protein
MIAKTAGGRAIARIVSRRASERGARAKSAEDTPRVELDVANGALARRISGAVVDALERAARATMETELPVVRFRTKKRRDVLVERDGLRGALVVIGVTIANLRRLIEDIDVARRAGAAGIQLVWDGASPPRDRAERHVFAALERARAAPTAAPVILADSSEPLDVLRWAARR